MEESYKLDKKRERTFKNYSAVVYDPLLLSFPNLSTASLNIADGRYKIGLLSGGHRELQKEALKGQADLVYQNKKFFLCVAMDFTEGTPIHPNGFLGVDKGIIDIATTSDGHTFSGSRIDTVRERNAKLRQALQKKGSKSAKKWMARWGGKTRQKGLKAKPYLRGISEIVAEACGFEGGLSL